MRVVWLEAAAANLNDQIAWIATADPWAAIDVFDAVMAAADRLVDHPALGRPGRVGTTRELPVVGTPYVIVHRLDPAEVVILRLLHGAQRWPPADR